VNGSVPVCSFRQGRAFARHRPGPSTLKPRPKHQTGLSPSGNAEFVRLGHAEQLYWLVAETTKCTDDSEGARLFLFFNAVEPVVRASRRRWR
jgi:hypothetical protein